MEKTCELYGGKVSSAQTASNKTAWPRKDTRYSTSEKLVTVADDRQRTIIRLSRRLCIPLHGPYLNNCWPQTPFHQTSVYTMSTTRLLTKAPFDRFRQPLRRCTRQRALSENHHGVEQMRNIIPVKCFTYSYAAIILFVSSDVKVLFVIIFLIGRYNFASENKRVVEENIFYIETDPELILSRSLSLGRLSK